VPFGHYTLVASKSGVPDVQRSRSTSRRTPSSPSNFDMQLKQIGRTQSAFVRGAGSAPVSVNSITQQQLAALPENQSLDNVIETLPGIVRFSYNEPVAHGFHGLTYELDGVPLAALDDLELQRDHRSRVTSTRSRSSPVAFPAEFGGSRQGAVVNIISHRSTT
jgi:hypothetical protein